MSLAQEQVLDLIEDYAAVSLRPRSREPNAAGYRLDKLAPGHPGAQRGSTIPHCDTRVFRIRGGKSRGFVMPEDKRETLRQMLHIRALSLEEAAARANMSRTTLRSALEGGSVKGKSWAKIGKLIIEVPPAPGLAELTGLG